MLYFIGQGTVVRAKSCQKSFCAQTCRGNEAAKHPSANINRKEVLEEVGLLWSENKGDKICEYPKTEWKLPLNFQLALW